MDIRAFFLIFFFVYSIVFALSSVVIFFLSFFKEKILLLDQGSIINFSIFFIVFFNMLYFSWGCRRESWIYTILINIFIIGFISYFFIKKFIMLRIKNLELGFLVLGLFGVFNEFLYMYAIIYLPGNEKNIYKLFFQICNNAALSELFIFAFIFGFILYGTAGRVLVYISSIEFPENKKLQKLST